MLQSFLQFFIYKFINSEVKSRSITLQILF
nr:MAG TPA: hypothetical protein [Caudoviricetes sp.]